MQKHEAQRIRANIEHASNGYPLYHARNSAYKTDTAIPFRVSPQPLTLPREDILEIDRIGKDIASFFCATDELYRIDERARKILDKGKPEIFTAGTDTQYLFIRPDLIITDHGLIACELETSPFGLSLAHILNGAYQAEGHDTAVEQSALPKYIGKKIEKSGTIVYSDKTASYEGQLRYLADNVFSQSGNQWSAQHVAIPQTTDTIYRGFYIGEYQTDPSIQKLLDAGARGEKIIQPSLTPHLEEKAIMAFLWDTRWETYFAKKLGSTAFQHLRSVIPPAWIVGEERFFAPGLPGNANLTADIATLSRSKRAYVLKSSGFSANSSWAEGVNFLHEYSAEQTRRLLETVTNDSNTVYVVQEFKQGKKIDIPYEGEHGIQLMRGRIRITPYVSTDNGALIAIKATACENTDRIHASSGSVNTAVSSL